MNARKLQTVSMAASALFVPIIVLGDRLIWSSKPVAASFLVLVYASVLIALFSTFVRFRDEQQASLARWRRTLYLTGVLVLLALCLLPLATWPIGLSGMTLHLRVVVLSLVGVNLAAAGLVWFGSGWSRLGLTVVAYWVWFLWLSLLRSGASWLAVEMSGLFEC